jgi:effector-binding domain-containing protein
MIQFASLTRRFTMSDIEVKIVRLEPTRVISAYGFGESPEGQAWEKLKDFAFSKGLVKAGESPQTFGFNNPSPSPGSPNYGYEIWLPVDEEIQPEGELRVKDFPGGLYAVTQFTGLENIGEVWRRLAAWREGSKYKRGAHQWLEELLTWPDMPEEEYTFNLYLPIVA